MATKPLGISLTNAMIDFENNQIVEFPKKNNGEIKVYDLQKILQQFNGVEGISFSIAGKIEIAPDEVKY